MFCAVAKHPAYTSSSGDLLRRLLEHGLRGVGALACKSTVLIETGFIKFYGHSLASADHSYFQSIFDMASLYSSRVRLLFFYGDYSVTARAGTYQRVLNLLSAYGETMDNEDHGKSLIHKPILKGRLSIVRL